MTAVVQQGIVIAMSVRHLSVVHLHFQLPLLARVSGAFILYCMVMVPRARVILVADVGHLEFKMADTQIAKKYYLIKFSQVCQLLVHELHTI